MPIRYLPSHRIGASRSTRWAASSTRNGPNSPSSINRRNAGSSTATRMSSNQRATPVAEIVPSGPRSE